MKKKYAKEIDQNIVCYPDPIKSINTHLLYKFNNKIYSFRSNTLELNTDAIRSLILSEMQSYDTQTLIAIISTFDLIQDDGVLIYQFPSSIWNTRHSVYGTNEGTNLKYLQLQKNLVRKEIEAEKIIV